MSWHYLQGQEAESWEGNSLDGAPSALLRLIPMPARSSSPASETASSSPSQSGMTFGPSMASLGGGALMLSPGASPAKTSAPQGKAQGSMGNALASGLSSPGSFARFDLPSSSWKTHGISLLEGSTEFSETWPRWGSMRNGECWARSTPALSTPGIVFGYWPTPTASMAKRGWGFGRETRGRYSKAVIQRARVDGWLPSPQLLEALMGWPIEWTALEPLATAKFQEWSNSHFQPYTAA